MGVYTVWGVLHIRNYAHIKAKRRNVYIIATRATLDSKEMLERRHLALAWFLCYMIKYTAGTNSTPNHRLIFIGVQLPPIYIQVNTKAPYMHVSADRLVQKVSAKSNKGKWPQRACMSRRKSAEKQKRVNEPYPTRTDNLLESSEQNWNQMRYHCANGSNETNECCLFVNIK